MTAIARRASAPAPAPTSGLIASLLRSRRLVQRNLLVYKRGWMVIFSGFFEPLFYLLGIGYGMGTLIGDIPLADGRSIPYAAFVAPALLAQASMNGAIAESIFNVFFKLNFSRRTTRSSPHRSDPRDRGGEMLCSPSAERCTVSRSCWS